MGKKNGRRKCHKNGPHLDRGEIVNGRMDWGRMTSHTSRYGDILWHNHKIREEKQKCEQNRRPSAEKA
jgi:hypothetical protein